MSNNYCVSSNVVDKSVETISKPPSHCDKVWVETQVLYQPAPVRGSTGSAVEILKINIYNRGFLRNQGVQLHSLHPYNLTLSIQIV